MPMQLGALQDASQLGALPGGKGKKEGKDVMGKEKGKGGKPKAKKDKGGPQKGASANDKDKTC